MATPKIHVAATIEPQDYEILQEMAALDDRPISAFLRMLIKNRIEQYQTGVKSAQKRRLKAEKAVSF